MIRSFLAVVLLILCFGYVKGQAPRVSPCKLYGAVFVEEVPSYARYKVFVENDESFSDLRVVLESTFAFADRPGIWYFTRYRDEADFTIAFVDTKAFADFSIYYTSFRTLAGCTR